MTVNFVIAISLHLKLFNIVDFLLAAINLSSYQFKLIASFRNHPVRMHHQSFQISPFLMLCDPADLIWRKGTPFEAMTDRTAPSSDGLLARFTGVFLGCKTNARRSMHSPRIISLSPLSLATNVNGATLRASDLWLGPQTGAGGTTTLSESFFDHSPWLHGQQVFKK